MRLASSAASGASHASFPLEPTRQRDCGRRGEAFGAEAVFPALSRAMFAASYPEGAHKLRHNLSAHPLLELDALAWLGEMLPEGSVDCQCVGLAIGFDGSHGGNGSRLGETIRGIRHGNGWVALNNIEQVPAYAALLAELLGELETEIVDRTGRMRTVEGSVFISSPGAVTPYHFDPGHTVVLQLAGKRAMTVFPGGNSLCAPDPVHETYHTGGGPPPTWRDELAEHGVTFRLEPGEAIYVPVIAPHNVRNGPEPSIALSITWRSEWSAAEADARAFNRLLRARGFDPLPPGRWPARNRAKSIAWRVLRRIPGIN